MAEAQDFDRGFFRNLSRFHRDVQLCIHGLEQRFEVVRAKMAKEEATSSSVHIYLVAVSPADQTVLRAFADTGCDPVVVALWVRFVHTVRRLRTEAAACGLDPPATLELSEPERDENGGLTFRSLMRVACAPPFDVLDRVVAGGSASSHAADGPGLHGPTAALSYELRGHRLRLLEGLKEWEPVLRKRVAELAAQTGWASRPGENGDELAEEATRRNALVGVMRAYLKDIPGIVSEIDEKVRRAAGVSEATVAATEVFELAGAWRSLGPSRERETPRRYVPTDEERAVDAEIAEGISAVRAEVGRRLPDAVRRLRDLVKGWPHPAEALLSRLVAAPEEHTLDDRVVAVLGHLLKLATALDLVRSYARGMDGTLPPRGEEVLRAMSELGATSLQTRRSAADIVQRAVGPAAGADSFKEVFQALKRLRLIDSLKQGRAGGYWLTTAGATCAAKWKE
jgi:hypothetical protein